MRRGNQVDPWPWRRSILAAIFLVVIVTVLPAMTSAQVAAPDPAECRIEPRTLPPPVPTTEAISDSVTASPFTVPTGTPVADDDAEAIRATVHEAVACANAGDWLRAFALFTDHYLEARFTGADAWTEDDFELFVATPATTAAAPDRLIIIAVSNIVRLPDGRAGATVTTQNAQQRFVDYLYFVEIGDRWLIDEIVQLSSPAPATPES
jgi:hypothetical protein